MAKEKVLFVIGGLRAGGAEKVCVSLINEFHRKGVNVSLMVLNLNRAVLAKQLDPSIPVYNLEVNHARTALLPMYRLLRNLQVQKCLSFNFQLSVLLVILQRFMGLRFKIYSRGISTFSEKISKESALRHKYLNAFLIQRLYKKSDLFIAQSSGMKVDMIESLGVDKDKIRIIYNPVFSFSESNDQLSTKVEQTAKREILFVGSLKPAKNISFLLRSIKLLHNKRSDFVFRIVGDGKLKMELMLETEKLQLVDCVIFEGFSERPSEYYRSASVCVLSSWYEGFPNVLIEALSYGVPVVSVDCKSGPSDIVVDGINGYLVNGYDENEFAARLEMVLDRKWDREEIKSSIAKFNFDKIFAEYKSYITDGEKD